MNSTATIEALMSELDAIRAQFRTIDHPYQQFGERKDLRELMEKHNCIVEDIHLLEQKPRCDPIDRLPEEVSVAILKQAVVRDSHGSSFISTDLVLLFTLVSSKWRSFIESTPTLWSDIVLDDKREDLAIKITISLFFSRQAHLTVQFVGPLRCWSEIEPILLPHADRIRSIYLEGGQPDKCFQNFSFFTVKPLVNPQLLSIVWDRYIYTVGQGEIVLSGQVEHLHRVTDIPFAKDVLYLPSIRDLTELSTHEDPNRVLAKDLPRLETVEFLEKVQTDKESVGMPLTVETLGWTSLTYHQGVSETLTPLLSRLPLLRDLILVIACDDLSQLISSMRNLKVLHSFKLELWGVSNEIFVPPITMAPLDQVRTFIFRNTRRNPGDAEKLSQLPDALFSLIPNVEFLEIKSYIDPMAYKLASAVGFHKVHTLFLDLWYTAGSFQPEDFEFSESVRNLTIDSLQSIGFIAPGIEMLQVFSLNAGSQCDTVQRLHFALFGSLSNNLQPFVSLTDIFVGGEGAATRFCTISATSLDTCPALHTLSFGQFPDLDILFIMLERRNLYSHASTARIRKLELPTRLSLFNFRTVRELLRGRMVERQSNFEASLQSNIDMFLDPDIPGCVACHKAQVFCSAPTRPVRDARVPPSSIPPYPAMVEDIINTCDSRALAISSLSVRSMTCRGKEDLIQFTDDSLECGFAPISYSL